MFIYKQLKNKLLLIIMFSFTTLVNTNLLNKPLKLIITNAKSSNDLLKTNPLKINGTELKRGDTKELEIQYPEGSNRFLCEISALGANNKGYLLGKINFITGFDKKEKKTCDLLEVSSSSAGTKYYANKDVSTKESDSEISLTETDPKTIPIAAKINLSNPIQITIRDYDLINVYNPVNKNNTLTLVIVNATSEFEPIKIINTNRDAEEEENLSYTDKPFQCIPIHWSGESLDSEPPTIYEIKAVKPYDKQKIPADAVKEYITLGTISLIPGINISSDEYKKRQSNEPIKYSGILKIEMNGIPKYYTNKDDKFDKMFLIKDLPELYKGNTKNYLKISRQINLNGTVYITIYDKMNASNTEPK